MIDKLSVPDDLSASAAPAEPDTATVARDLSETAREQILAMAQIEGWSDSQADWLDTLAKQPLFQMVADGVPGSAALEKAFAIARRQLTVGYFDHALDEGRSRDTAFLTVIDLEKQVTERRGAPAPDYPDAILMEACRAVEAAADAGAASENQIAAGFAVIRTLMDQPQH